MNNALRIFPPVLTAYTVAAALMLGSCTGTQVPGNPDGTTNDKDAVIANNTVASQGATTMNDFASLCYYQVDAARLAQSNSERKDIQELARSMEYDYTRMLNELRAMAEMNKVTLPTVMSDESKLAYDDLAAHTNLAFDREYCEQIRRQQQWALPKLATVVNDQAENEQFRTWARETTNMINGNIVLAENCLQTLDAVQGTAEGVQR